MIGWTLAISAAFCWGIQGPISQFLFQDASYSPEWLMGVKDTIAGLLILLFAKSYQRQHIFRIWHDKKHLFMFLCYAILGMAAVQYFYLVLVKASNSATGTILQNLGTVLIMLVTIAIYHWFPTVCEWIALIASIIGTWMLITKGDMTKLSISKEALIIGVLLIIAATLHTMLPVPLLRHYPTSILVGWAMLLGGIIFSFIHPFWVDAPKLTFGTFMGVAFIVVFSTILAFMFFISSLKYITPTVAGMLDTFEPLSATVGMIMFLGTPFNGAEIIGGILILSVVFILAADPAKHQN
ncbi:EamA family transporter [uncultured bacterium]|uniref:EamA family transporter n=2 Tax=Acetilactobacillus jinshanensis TaxID=1720083 RepID=A0A4P6ZNI2_9LACO|nr:EamA family transporter [Acetilactobacillus jinshanensis]URL61875.1 EamA family transporter [uncultured bacterium]